MILNVVLYQLLELSFREFSFVCHNGCVYPIDDFQVGVSIVGDGSTLREMNRAIGNGAVLKGIQYKMIYMQGDRCIHQDFHHDFDRRVNFNLCNSARQMGNVVIHNGVIRSDMRLIKFHRGTEVLENLSLAGVQKVMQFCD